MNGVELGSERGHAPDRNVRRAEAGLRCVAGVALIVVAFLATDLPALSFLAFLAAIVLLATGVTRTCPFYVWLRNRVASR